MARPVLLVAASGLAREVANVLRRQTAYDILGILDDDPATQGSSIDGHPVLGSLECAREHPDASFVVCAGKGRVRESMVEHLTALGIEGRRYPTIVDPSVHIPGNCKVGAGSILLSHVVLTADVTVGRHVVAMPHVVLTHDDVVGDYATLCAGTVLGGFVKIGRRAYMGMNSSVRQHLEVGDDSVLGMGSALLEDLPVGETWAGVPARNLVDEEVTAR